MSRAAALVPLLTSAALLAPSVPAHACGGLFCASGSAVPQPVDQNAERIVFVVNGGGTITAHVQINYAGGADSFAWVVPVPSMPTVTESTVSFLDQVDRSTQMQVQLPPVDCAFPQASSGGGLSCGGCAANESASPAPSAGGNSSVIVYGGGTTANYRYDIIGGTRSADVVEWLKQNRYNVSDNMIPGMEPYAARGKRFVALKLLDGRGVSNITPVALTYEGTEPEIPIQLTAVAAQPLMGILTLIVADEPFIPANYLVTRPEPDEIHTDGVRTSYFEWVALRAAKVQGRLWVSESITDDPTGRVVSRYYTRMSPEHMTMDPIFKASPERLLRQVPVLDLSARDAIFDCNGPITGRIPGPCAFNFCGMGARCIVDGNNQTGCLCDAGQVAQRISGPDGQLRVTCTPRENPLGVTAEAGGAGTSVDPCRQFDCGTGTCVLKGGFPVCECPAGSMAGFSGAGCVVTPPSFELFGTGAGPEAAPKGALRTQLGPWSLPFVVAIGWIVRSGRRRAR